MGKGFVKHNCSSLPSMLFRLLILSLSAAVFIGDRISRLRQKLMGRPVPGTCVFITYHTITEGTRDGFAGQMALLKRFARVIPSPENARFEPGCHYVAVTFDDAFRSFTQNALPVLAEFELPVILFVPTGYLGRKSTWFDYGTENPVGEDVVSADELKQLARQHRIEIGSHTVNHPNLAEISLDEARAELRDSRSALETLLERRINSISFPYGSYGPREIKLARETGYDFCFSVSPQTLVGSIPPGLVGRVPVQPSDWDIEFRLKAQGAYRWLAWAGAWKRKLKRQPSPAALIKETKAHG
jgi:peptidoglycan/xylan/chitin deacetylase (PgdA/CDA1 family)